jgi:hypothetical protein
LFSAWPFLFFLLIPFITFLSRYSSHSLGASAWIFTPQNKKQKISKRNIKKFCRFSLFKGENKAMEWDYKIVIFIISFCSLVGPLANTHVCKNKSGNWLCAVMWCCVSLHHKLLAGISWVLFYAAFHFPLCSHIEQ